MDKIRMVLGIDNSFSRKGLTAIFKSENIFDVIESMTVTEAIDIAVEAQPDVVLLDILDNVMKNEKRIRQLKNECPCSLILTLVDDEQCEKFADLLAQGIDGFIPRGIMQGQLLKTVELICRSGIFCLPGSAKNRIVFTGTINHINLDVGHQLIPGSNECLTKREVEVLRLMAQNYSNKEIGKKLFISEPTVKTHVSNILRKLRQSNRAQAIIYSYQCGLLKDMSINE
jgi:DNA-binding NarL/FixJ family response regulator